MAESEPSHEPSGLGQPSSQGDKAAETSPPSAARGGVVWEWLWQSQRAKALREERVKLSPRGRELIARAQTGLEAAEHLAQLWNPEGSLAASAPATNLLREAASWAALSLLERGASSSQAGAPSLDPTSWAEACNLAGIANGVELGESWLFQPSEAAWESPPSRERLGELLHLTADLVRAAQRGSHELDALWLRRAARVGIPVLAAGIGLSLLAYSAHRRAVVAETAYPWTVSSGQGDGCTPPSQECAEVRYFFHTREERDPWIEFDVGKEAPIASVRVANRNDCAECPARAVPLVVEVSNDHETWTEVGRKQETFDAWDLKIGRSARWIRFRALKRTFLHFRQVRIRAET